MLVIVKIKSSSLLTALGHLYLNDYKILFTDKIHKMRVHNT